MEATLARKNDDLSILGPGSSLSIPLQLGTPPPPTTTPTPQHPHLPSSGINL